jgi:16S rRNA (uracil1498-N3)-methyltransferase
MRKNHRRTLPRFLAPDLDPSAPEVQLPRDESRHLTRVLRLEEGALIAVFDGRGREFLARVVNAGTGAVTVALLSPVDPAAEPLVPFSLVQAVLKGAAMDEVVRDATMMGASWIEPIVTARTIVRPSSARPSNARERWRRIAVAAAKQCRRATVPLVREPRSFAEWLQSADSYLKLFFAEPSADCDPQSLRTLLGRAAPANAALIVGPEGGWASEEARAAVDAGCLPVTLGRLTLRADAAPVAAMSVFRFLWEM